nr:MAG: hypothetical protein [Bacteriophage sp.]
MRLNLEVPSFTGFYQGIWDQSENEWIEVHEMKYGDYEDFESLNLIDDWGFGSDYRDNVAKLFAKNYAEIIKNCLAVPMEYVGCYVDSPKEYNFRTDRIYATFEVPDYDALVKRLNELGSLPEYRTELAAIIKKYHTSCSGFISFMSNDIEDWFGLMYDPSNDHYTSYFIGYLLSLMAPEEIEGLNESVYEYVLENTDYHCVEPETDDAKEEWELYLQYRDIYTEFASSNPMRYENPDKGKWPPYIVLDWDDYKEQFLDYIKKHEQEQKRKAALAAMPVIPGLFD